MNHLLWVGFCKLLNRYLRWNGYTFFILNDKDFWEGHDILTEKQKQLKAMGEGNKIIADEEELWRAGEQGEKAQLAFLLIC